MRNRVVLGGALLFLCVGCASDQREGLANSTVDLLAQTKTRVSVITEKIDEAMNKAQKGALNLDEAMEAAKDLKATGERLQKTNSEIRVLGETSSEERQRLLERHQSTLQSEVKKLDEAVNSLDKKFRELEKKFPEAANKSAIEELGKKLKEAEGEFYGLARQTQ